MSAHWHKTSTREKKVNTARNLKKLDIAAAKDLLCKVSQTLPRGTEHASLQYVIMVSPTAS